MGGGERAAADPGRARADRARGRARHRLRVGGRAPLPRGVLALERARGVPRRRVATHEAHPARSRHRADAAAVQPPGAHRRAHRDARPRVERSGRLRHRRVELRGRARWVPDRPHGEARDVGGGPARRAAVPRRDAVHRATPARTSRCRRATWSRSRRSARTRRCGWRAAGATRSCSRRRRASARSRSRSSIPRKRASGSPTTTRRWRPTGYRSATRSTARSRASPRSCVTRTRRPRSARGIAGANFFGYSLAHYYVFGRHQPGVTDVWAEYEQRRTEQGFDPEAVAAAAVNEDRLGAKIVDEGTAGLRGAVGTPDQVREYLRRYEEAGVDQVILTAQAGQEPARAHHGEPRAVRTRGAARVHRTRARRRRAAARRARSA